MSTTKSAKPAPVNTRKVQGRREVRYGSFDELLSDAEQLSYVEVRLLGNWSQGQIYEHLARSMNAAIDGFDMSLPLPVRWVMKLLFKNRFLNGQIPPGFATSKSMTADAAISLEEGLASLRRAVERQNSETHRAPHPGFGNITREESDQFHLRHAEMHMSFIAEV